MSWGGERETLGKTTGTVGPSIEKGGGEGRNTVAPPKTTFPRKKMFWNQWRGITRKKPDMEN